MSVIGMLCAAVPDLPIYLSQTLHFALREIMDCGARGGLTKGLGKTWVRLYFMIQFKLNGSDGTNHWPFEVFTVS